MAIKENMLSILIFIIAEGAIYLIVVGIFTQIFPEAAMPCQKLRPCLLAIQLGTFPISLWAHRFFIAASHLICHSFKLFCLSSLRSSVVKVLPIILILSYILFSSIAITPRGVVPDMTPIASYEAVRKSLATLRGLKWNKDLTVLAYTQHKWCEKLGRIILTDGL